MRILFFFCVLCICCGAIKYKSVKIAKQATQLKNAIVPSHGVTLGWEYTNVTFIVQASTNLIDWYFKTNVGFGSMQVFIPSTMSSEMYRMRTVIRTESDGFYVETLNCYTNQ